MPEDKTPGLFDDTTPKRPGVDYTDVRVCPLCGGTMLESQVVVTAKQNEDGTWTIVLPEQEDIDFEMRNPNNEVKCTNPHCGQLFTAEGEPVPFTDGDSALIFFLQKHHIVLPEITEEALAEKHPDLFAEYEEMVNGLYRVPWEGVIADTRSLYDPPHQE